MIHALATIVLFVDDDRDVLDSFGLFLETAGLQVTKADNALDAIAAAAERQPNVIVLDLAMPGVDGHAVLNALEAREDTAEIPVVIFTGTFGRLAANSQVRAVIQKPCLPYDLLDVVRDVGGRARL